MHILLHISIRQDNLKLPIRLNQILKIQFEFVLNGKVCLKIFTLWFFFEVENCKKTMIKTCIKNLRICSRGNGPRLHVNNFFPEDKFCILDYVKKHHSEIRNCFFFFKFQTVERIVKSSAMKRNNRRQSRNIKSLQLVK